MARDDRARTEAPGTTDDEGGGTVGGGAPSASTGAPTRALDGPDDRSPSDASVADPDAEARPEQTGTDDAPTDDAGPGGPSAIPEAEVEAADHAVAEAIARYSTQPRPGGAREAAAGHAARESMAAIEKFLGLARAAGDPGREAVWVGRVLKHRVKAWQLVYDFDADFSYVARMDRGIYLTKKGKLLFTVADSKPLRRRVAWKTAYGTLDTFMARFTAEHEATKVPMLHHRRLLDGIARICAQQHLDWG